MNKQKTKNPPVEFEQTFHSLSTDQIKVGEILTFVNYVVVQSVDTDESKVAGTKLTVRNLDTGEITDIKGKGLIQHAYSTDFFAETVHTSQSNIIRILMKSYNTPFTVVFDKEDGTERVLRGRLIEPDIMRGRSKTEDLDNEPKDRFRLTDHRTLKSLIIEGVKYIAK